MWLYIGSGVLVVSFFMILWLIGQLCRVETQGRQLRQACHQTNWF